MRKIICIGGTKHGEYALDRGEIFNSPLPMSIEDDSIINDIDAVSTEIKEEVYKKQEIHFGHTDVNIIMYVIENMNTYEALTKLIEDTKELKETKKINQELTNEVFACHNFLRDYLHYGIAALNEPTLFKLVQSTKDLLAKIKDNVRVIL